MKYAIIIDGVVVNIAVSNNPLAANWEPVPISCPVAIGDTYTNGCFYATDGELRLSPDVQLIKDSLDEYEASYEMGVQDA